MRISKGKFNTLDLGIKAKLSNAIFRFRQIFPCPVPFMLAAFVMDYKSSTSSSPKELATDTDRIKRSISKHSKS